MNPIRIMPGETEADFLIRRRNYMIAESVRMSSGNSDFFQADEPLMEKAPDSLRVMLQTTMKQRHLRQVERRDYHRPENDWKETPKGDVCISANTLKVDDITKKYDMITV